MAPLLFIHILLILLILIDLREDFREEPVSDQLISGDSAVLECTPPRGYPTPEVTWLKDDQPIILDNNRVKIVEDGNLLLKEVRHTSSSLRAMSW